MTPQEIFYAAATHLLTQNKRAFRQYGALEGANGCLYRGPDGTKCAVGALIPDEVYVSDMEGLGIEEILDQYTDGMNELGLFSEDLGLLEALQDCHDNYKPHEWPERLREIDENYRLGVMETTDIPPVQEKD